MTTLTSASRLPNALASASRRDGDTTAESGIAIGTTRR
jgi:hypothetical protein